MLKPRQSDPEHCLLTTLPAGHWSGMERHKDGLIVASDPLDLTSSLPKEACNQKQLKVSFWCLFSIGKKTRWGQVHVEKSTKASSRMAEPSPPTRLYVHQILNLDLPKYKHPCCHQDVHMRNALCNYTLGAAHLYCLKIKP